MVWKCRSTIVLGVAPLLLTLLGGCNDSDSTAAAVDAAGRAAATVAPITAGAPAVIVAPTAIVVPSTTVVPDATVAPTAVVVPAATTASTGVAASAGTVPPAGTAASAGTAADAGIPASLSISGSPSLSVVAGAAYSFRPGVSDVSGGVLNFTVQNLPSWAFFDSTTGTISGTPATANVGKSAAISVGVSDGVTTTTLAPFVITVTSNAQATASLSWAAPTADTDGSTPDLAGYRIHYGTDATSLTNVIDTASVSTSYVVDKLTPGTWYFAITAYNEANVESSLSVVVPITL